MFGLNYFIQYLLKPIKLMRKRISSLRRGNLRSKIPVISNDELADLSKAMNTMIEDIRSLLGEKEQLLLDVSHEFRSPLSRMRLLIELIPEHSNQKRLVDEIVFLEGMVSNLLLSDKLSIPYSNLEYSHIKTSDLIRRTLRVVGADINRFSINNMVPNLFIAVDETKMIVAVRNILDNAIKYGDSKKIIFIQN